MIARGIERHDSNIRRWRNPIECPTRPALLIDERAAGCVLDVLTIATRPTRDHLREYARVLQLAGLLVRRIERRELKSPPQARRIRIRVSHGDLIRLPGNVRWRNRYRDLS